MDWTASGIKNSFRYELIDARQLDVSYGWLDGVVGGTLTEGYRSDYRVSASLNLDGAEIPLGTAVRIWHDAELNGETYTECLATLFPELDAAEYKLGRWSGAADLHSALKRLDTDKRQGNRTINGSLLVKDRFIAIVKASGGSPIVKPFFSSGQTLGAGHVWQGGESVLTECNRCANACSGWIGVDVYGHVTLEPYQLPASRTVSFDIQPATLFLVGFNRDAKEIVNKVVATYTKDDTPYEAVAVVSDTHPWAFNRIGRWETYVATVDNIDTNATAGQIQDALNNKVVQELRSHSDVTGTYSASILYTPEVYTGAVGNIYYQDSPDDEGITKKMFVSGREISLDAAMVTNLTLEEVL